MIFASIIITVFYGYLDSFDLSDFYGNQMTKRLTAGVQ